MYFLEEGYGIRSSQVTYNNRKASVFSQSKLSDYNLEKSLEGIDAIHMCGISLAMSENLREIVYSIASLANKKGIKVIFDFNYRPSIWEGNKNVKKYYEKMLKYANLVFATEMDAKYILGIDGEYKGKKEEIKGLLQKMISKYDLDLIAGTIRKNIEIKNKKLQGFLVTSEKSIFSKEYDLHVFDRVGGGDGYAAGVIHSFLEGEHLEKVVEYATVSGVLAHTNYGDTPISTKEDIEEILKGTIKELKR